MTSLNLTNLKRVVKARNTTDLPLITLLSDNGIMPSDLGEAFPLKDGREDGWFWQTPYGDLIQYADGSMRINDEGESNG